MNILAMDSSQELLSVALAAENNVWYTEIDAGPRHSELLIECCDSLLKTAGLGQNELNLVLCMKGPGSFTGLRISYAAAKGLALALGIPMLALPTLDCLAHPLSVWPGIVLPAIDAKQSRFFAALYRGGTRLTDYMDSSPEALTDELAKARLFPEEKIILTGSGAALLCSRLSGLFPSEHILLDPQFRRGRARELLELAKYAIVKNGDDFNSGPVYLRKSDAELNRR